MERPAECACEETHADHNEICEQTRGDESQLGYCDACWQAHDLDASPAQEEG